MQDDGIMRKEILRRYAPQNDSGEPIPGIFTIRGQRAYPNKQCYTFKATPHDPCGLQKVGAVDYAALP